MPDVLLDRFARLGCARHLLFIGAGLAVALGIGIARNWDAASRVAEDAVALREGADEARALRSPADLREWLRQHPERGALVVWDLGSDSVIAVVGEASVSRPAVALPLLAPALDVLIRPDTVRLGPRDLRRLPGIEQGAADSGAVSVAAVARRAFRGDRAAGDSLLHLAGDSTAGPPLDGLLVAWSRAARRDSLPEWLARPRETLHREAWAISRRLRSDDAFRQSVGADLAARGLGLSREEQRRAAAATFPRLRADSLARWIGRVAGARDPLRDAFLSIATEPATDSLRARGGVRLGVFGGGFPGVQSTAGVLTREDGGGRVAVLLLDDVPHAVFYHLAQTGLDVGLVLEALDLGARP